MALTRRSVLRLGAGGLLTLVVAGCGDEPKGDSPDPEAGVKPRTFTVPEVRSLERTSWSTDPWALGSYSYLPVGATPGDRATLRTGVAGRVFFAGEATDEDNPSTVHGALASGTRVATDVAKVAAPGERVVVIGAGISGLRAAADLHAAGYAVTVVEARDRVGGRIDTVRPTGWPIPVERGASWVHDTAASDLADQLDALGVRTVAFDYSTAVVGLDGARVADGAALDEAGARAVAAAVRWADSLDEDRALATALDESADDLHVDPSTLAYYEATEIVTEYGADADELSAQWGLEEGTEGDDLLVVGGYDGLVQPLAADLDVRLSRPVDRIVWDPSGVVVHGPDHDPIPADRVVVTVPLGVLQAGTVAFDPALPAATVAAVEHLGMGLLDKYWFRFDEVFWEEDAVMWTKVGPATDQDPFREWFNLAPATGRPILLALLGADAARAWATKTDAEIKAAAMVSLQEFLGAGW